jgi:hypothetical protein
VKWRNLKRPECRNIPATISRYFWNCLWTPLGVGPYEIRAGVIESTSPGTIEMTAVFKSFTRISQRRRRRI